MINQQRSPDEGNVQRLELELVPLNGETENILKKDEDIVRNKRGFNRLKGKEHFLKEAYNKFGNKFEYDLTNYSGITGNPIKIICPKHGQFEKVPHTFLLKNNKCGCTKCGLESKNNSKTKSYERLIEDFKKIHGDYYEYSEINKESFVNRKSKIVINCKNHGQFIKSAQKHLSGQGCWQCKVESLIKNNILIGGYSEELFNSKPELKEKKAYLYYISINNGKLYKIGISTSLETRMKGIKSKAKTFIKSMDLLWTIEDTLYNCFKKEQEILEKFKENRVFFKWSTELFNLNILPIKLDQF